MPDAKSASVSLRRRRSIVPESDALERETAPLGERDFESGRSRCAIGQHDHAPLCRRPLHEIEREFPARTASEPRAESVGDLLRERSGIFRVRPGSELGGCFDEVPVGDAIAEADVHGSANSAGSEPNGKWE